jgi:hypothetical protein
MSSHARSDEPVGLEFVVRGRATLPQSWIQRENREFETRRRDENGARNASSFACSRRKPVKAVSPERGRSEAESRGQGRGDPKNRRRDGRVLRRVDQVS